MKNQTKDKAGISGKNIYHFKEISGSLVFVYFITVFLFGSTVDPDWPKAGILLVIFAAGFFVMTASMSKDRVGCREYPRQVRYRLLPRV